MRLYLLSMSCLGLICSLVSPSVASSSTSLATNSQVLDGIVKIAPSRSLVSTDVPIEDIITPGSNDLDGASVGAFALSPTDTSYWTFDSLTNPTNIYALSFVDGAWRTFTTSLSASWNASSNITLAETIRNGATSPTSPYSLVISLTKASTGTPADLTKAVLANFLSKSTISNLSTSGGASLSSVNALTAGWTAKALIQDGTSTAVTASSSTPVLDPINVTASVTVTPAVGSPITLSASLTNLHLWNIASGSTITKDVLFSGTGSRTITYQPKPGSFVRTSGISKGLIDALNASPKLLNQTNKTYLNDLPTAINAILPLMATTAPSSMKVGLNTVANSRISSTSFDATAYTTGLSLTPISVGTGGQLGLIALTSGNITVSSWSIDDTIIKATGQIGSASAKDFTCDLSSLGSASFNTTSSVLQFTAPDGDAFWLKCLTADTATPPSLDVTADTSIATALKKNFLALRLQNTLNGTTTITAKTLAVIAGV